MQFSLLIAIRSCELVGYQVPQDLLQITHHRGVTFMPSSVALCYVDLHALLEADRPI